MLNVLLRMLQIQYIVITGIKHFLWKNIKTERRDDQ